MGSDMVETALRAAAQRAARIAALDAAGEPQVDDVPDEVTSQRSAVGLWGNMRGINPFRSLWATFMATF